MNERDLSTEAVDKKLRVCSDLLFAQEDIGDEGILVLVSIMTFCPSQFHHFGWD